MRKKSELRDFVKNARVLLPDLDDADEKLCIQILKGMEADRLLHRGVSIAHQIV